MAIPGFVVKGVFERAGAYIGGPLGAVIGGLAATSAVAEKEAFEVGKKIADGDATFSDIFRLTAALEGALLSGELIGAALGLAVAPSLLVMSQPVRRRSRRAPHSGSVRAHGSRKQKAMRHAI